jgi:hypothetical protein
LTARTFIEKQVKSTVLKSYLSSTGRFDIESLKIDLTKMCADKTNEAQIADRMRDIALG